MPPELHHNLVESIDAAEIARVCADLVRLNTSGPPGNEGIAARYVAAYLEPVGFRCHFLPYPDEEGRESVVCRLPAGTAAEHGSAAKSSAVSSGSGAPALVFNGHLDVVPVGEGPWHYEPFGGTIADGRVWGRGAADMKSGVAAMLVAARALAGVRRQLRGDLLVAATAGEELGMLGAGQVAGWPLLGPVGAIIISEPTGNRLGLAERGALVLELTTYGQTAHASTPHLGQNAVNMMRTLLDGIDRLDIPYTRHPVLGDFSYSIDTIHGGTAHNVVPDHCVAQVDLRTVPGQDQGAILAAARRLIDALADQQPGFRASARISLDLPAVETPADHPAVARFAAAVEQATGTELRYDTVRFATEAAIFVPALGVPALIFGPGDPALAHQPNEHAGISAMTEAARIYLAAALEMLT